MSSSSSFSFNSNANRGLPTHCNCNPPLPLKNRTSWTPANPARRFLTCPNSMSAWKRCGAYWFIDEELTNDWYKQNLIELYSALNRDQKETFRDSMRNREMVVKMNEEFERYKSRKEDELMKMQMELHTVKTKALLMKKFLIILVMIVVCLVIFR